MAAGADGESTKNTNKPIFLVFCHFASLPNGQTLLTDLTIALVGMTLRQCLTLCIAIAVEGENTW
jgi:hypothetical protein